MRVHRITERLWNVRSTTKILVCWLVCSCGALSASDQPHAEAWFPTGEPELLEREPSLIPLLSEEEYRTLAEAMQGNPAFIALRDTPPALSQDVRFGSNLSYSGKNRSFALDGTDKRGLVVAQVQVPHPESDCPRSGGSTSWGLLPGRMPSKTGERVRGLFG